MEKESASVFLFLLVFHTYCTLVGVCLLAYTVCGGENISWYMLIRIWRCAYVTECYAWFDMSVVG